MSKEIDEEICVVLAKYHGLIKDAMVTHELVIAQQWAVGQIKQAVRLKLEAYVMYDCKPMDCVAIEHIRKVLGGE